MPCDQSNSRVRLSSTHPTSQPGQVRPYRCGAARLPSWYYEVQQYPAAHCQGLDCRPAPSKRGHPWRVPRHLGRSCCSCATLVNWCMCRPFLFRPFLLFFLFFPFFFCTATGFPTTKLFLLLHPLGIVLFFIIFFGVFGPMSKTLNNEIHALPLPTHDTTTRAQTLASSAPRFPSDAIAVAVRIHTTVQQPPQSLPA